MAHFLVIRLSAIGDVAMTLPVIYSVARLNPEHTFTVLTQTFLMPIFMNRPKNVRTIGLNTRSSEKTLGGLLRFVSALSRYDFDAVIDLHDVIRTKIIRTALRVRGKKAYVIDKGRDERQALIRPKGKIRKPSRQMVDRYADVFRSAGLRYEATFVSLFERQRPAPADVQAFTGEKQGRWIGVAPFAKHQGKIYPIEQMEEVVAALSKEEDTTIFLFGGRGYEEAVLEEWAYRYPRVKNVVGRFSLDLELVLIARLDLLVSMDSANMHFASLVGTRVLSIWGATHPYAGFYGYRQSPADQIQLDLPCRPCSVFGEKPCARKDYACMAQIEPSAILKKIKQLNETHDEIS